MLWTMIEPEEKASQINWGNNPVGSDGISVFTSFPLENRRPINILGEFSFDP